MRGDMGSEIVNRMDPSSCPDLEPYLNRELPSGACQAIERHLSVCGVCREQVEAYRELERSLSVAQVSLGLSEEARERILGRLQGEEVEVVTARRWRRWVVGAMFATAASVLVLLAIQSPERREVVSGLEGQSLEASPSRVVKETSPVTVGDGWLIAKHPASDDQIEIYVMRPTLGTASH